MSCPEVSPQAGPAFHSQGWGVGQSCWRSVSRISEPASVTAPSLFSQSVKCPLSPGTRTLCGRVQVEDLGRLCRGRTFASLCSWRGWTLLWWRGRTEHLVFILEMIIIKPNHFLPFWKPTTFLTFFQINSVHLSSSSRYLRVGCLAASTSLAPNNQVVLG